MLKTEVKKQKYLIHFLKKTKLNNVLIVSDKETQKYYKIS